MARNHYKSVLYGDQGELIGEIRAMQRVLKQPVSSREELVPKNKEELQAILKQLKEQLR